MSFVSSLGPRAADARKLATPLVGAAQGGSPGDAQANRNEEDSKHVQQAVQQIQQSAAEIRKETERLHGAAQGAAAKGYEGSRSSVEAARRRADAAADESKRLLDGLLARAGGTTLSEQTHWRVMERKLKDALTLASNDLKVALRNYEAADQEARRASPVSSNQPSFVPDLEAPIGSARRNATGVEMHAIHAMAQDEVAQAEVDTHVAMTQEYCEQASSLAQDVLSLQGAMRDLATHAQSQHDVVNNIESNLLRAVDDSRGTNEELALTGEHQRKNAKYICALLVVALIIAGLVVFIVVRQH